jgi:hypothetical protein
MSSLLCFHPRVKLQFTTVPPMEPEAAMDNNSVPPLVGYRMVGVDRMVERDGGR